MFVNAFGYEPKRKIRFPEQDYETSRAAEPWKTADEKATNLDANEHFQDFTFLMVFPQNKSHFDFSLSGFYGLISFQILRNGLRTLYCEKDFKFIMIIESFTQITKVSDTSSDFLLIYTCFIRTSPSWFSFYFFRARLNWNSFAPFCWQMQWISNWIRARRLFLHLIASTSSYVMNFSLSLSRKNAQPTKK
jgi:hypothetical protein